MELDFLESMGFTRGEISVYNALLELGPSATGALVKEAGVSSSKIYIILDKLVRKGVATYIIRSGKRQYQATDPGNIIDFIEKRKAELERQKEIVTRMLPRLAMRRERLEKEGAAEIFEGLKGVKSYFNGLLKAMKKGDEMMVFGARSGYPVSRSAQRFFSGFHRKRASRGIGLRIIFNRDLAESGLSRFFAGLGNTQVRFIDQVTLSSIGIQKGHIDILIWTRESAIVFVIRSREVASTFRKYFNVLWEAGMK